MNTEKSNNQNAHVDVLVAIGDSRLAVRWLLADARIQRRYIREDAKFGRGVMVKSAPTPHYVLRTIHRDLLLIRRSRAALARTGR